MSLVGVLALVQVCVSAPESLSPSLGKVNGLFGAAVAQHGDRIVVGAQYEWAPGGGGAVYVFEPIGGSWHEQARLFAVNSPPQVGTFRLGYSVACDDTRIAAGAPGADLPGGYDGLVIVWKRVGSSWVEEGILEPPQNDEVQPVRDFGRSVALSGDTLLVGAPGIWSSSSTGPGAAFVFRNVAQSWHLEAILGASDPLPRNDFGGAVALEGDLAVVGAARANGLESAAGAAYVFSRNGSTWTQQQKLVASDGKMDERFGVCMVLDGDRLAVGAVQRAEIYTLTGAVYLFERSGGAWHQSEILVPADIMYPVKLFGQSVALDGDILLGGAPNQFAAPGGGWFHIYKRSASGWDELLKLSAPGAMAADQVGRALSVQGNRLVVGAAQYDGTFMNEGAVFVYELQTSNPAPTFYCTPKQDSQGCTPIIHHVGLPSVSAAAGSYYNVLAHFVRAGTLGTFLYSKGGPNAAPFAGGTLCLAPPIQRTGGLTSGGTSACFGSFTYDFGARIASGIDPGLVAGQDVWFQYWYRDHGAPPGQEVGLTSAIYVQVCP